MAPPMTENETTPLLREGAASVPERLDGSGIDLVKQAPASRFWYILPMVLVACLATALPTTTTLAIIRLIICRHWYERNDPHALTPHATPSEEMCSVPSVQTAYSTAIAIMGAVDAFATMISFGAINYFVKRLGRRPVFMGITSIAATAHALFITALNTSGIVSLVLAAIAIVTAALGTVTAFVLTGRMFVVDTTSPMQRTTGLSFLGAFTMLGLTPSYALGGFITQHFKHITAVYWVALCGQFLVLLYQYFILPETYFPEDRAEAIEEMQYTLASELPEDNQTKGIRHALRVAFQPLFSIFEPLLVLVQHIPGSTKRDYNLLIAGLASFSWYLGNSYLGLAIMVRLSSEFHLPPYQTGVGMSVLTGAKAAFLVILFPGVIKYGRLLYAKYLISTGKNLSPVEIARRTDTLLIIVSYVTDAIFVSAIGFAKTKEMIFICAILMGFAAGGHIALNSLLVSSVNHSQSDDILSANAMLESVGQVLSPILLGTIMSETVNTFPPAMFLTSSSIMIVCGCVILVFRAVDKPDRRIGGSEHHHHHLHHQHDA